MFSWLRNLFHRSGRQTAEQAPEPLQKYTLRRWEAAETSRLNKAHWAKASADGQSINVDLAAKLKTLRARSAYELANNPILEGVIFTHQVDVVGPHGPSLQVQSDSPDYNRKLEAIHRQWWKNPVVGKRMSGGELLRLWVRNLWLCGEYLAQKVTKQNAAGPVKFRLKPIPPRRLDTPPAQIGDADVALGVRRNHDGEPTQYYIADPKPFGVYALVLNNFSPVPADLIIHNFIVVEEDQVRGVPWTACVLDVIADVRDYDAEVLDAARQAADQAVLLSTKHPDATYIEVNESTEIQRRTISTLPPGWEATQIVAQQPSAQYVDYRRERMAEIGRPVSMPLMMVRLSAEDHSYSSARFDGQIYLRALRVIQAFIAGDLDDLVDEVAREAELAGALPKRPQNVRYEWTWPVPPHVDPKKEAEAEDIGLSNLTRSLSDSLAAQGKDIESHIAKLVADNQKLKLAGLPTLPIPRKGAKPSGEKPDDDEGEGQGDEKPPPKSRTRSRVNANA